VELTESAQFEICVNGHPRTHRDVWEIAIEAAEFLKSLNPECEIIIRDRLTDKRTPVPLKPGNVVSGPGVNVPRPRGGNHL
jgi:hypothetical protein